MKTRPKSRQNAKSGGRALVAPLHPMEQAVPLALARAYDALDGRCVEFALCATCAFETNFSPCALVSVNVAPV